MFNFSKLPFMGPKEDDKRVQADLEFAKKLQEEEYSRYKRLRSQFDEERAAETRGVFAKKQRVRYNNQSTGTCHSAIVVGVHLDDDPNKPYYTIKYKKSLTSVDENGAESVTFAEVEKQTEQIRLTRVVWDDDAAWEALNGRVL